MEVLIKINNQTAGRDKIARLLQYACRIVWYKLHQNNKKSVNEFKNLEFQLSTFRKLLRLGRCLDVIYSILPLLNYPDSIVRSSVILAKISHALFLLADHILWIGRADLYTINTEKWSRTSNKYWLLSVTMNLFKDFYEICQIINDNKSDIMPKKGIKDFNDIYKTFSKTALLVQKNRNIVIDTIKNGCDVFIPLTALGHVRLSPDTVGWLGVLSSVAGIMVLIDPVLKLPPS